MVSFIIVNYKQKKLLKECICSAFSNFRSYPFEIIIVNNSTEEDLLKLKSSVDSSFNLRIINNENTGYSKANNLGAEKAKGKYILFLNPDTLIENDFLKQLVNHFENIKFGAVGLKVMYPDGTFQVSFGKEISVLNEYRNKKIEKLYSKGKLRKIYKLEKKYKTVRKVDWVSGVALFIRKKVFEEVNGFDENYFLYYEDADLCKRLKNKGYENYFYPFSKIVHYKGEITNKEFFNNVYNRFKESQSFYYKKHKSFLQRLLVKLHRKIKN